MYMRIKHKSNVLGYQSRKDRAVLIYAHQEQNEK